MSPCDCLRAGPAQPPITAAHLPPTCAARARPLAQTLAVEWQPPGQELRVRVRASLAAAQPPAPIVADLLGLALDNVAALAAAAQQAQQVAAEFEKQVGMGGLRRGWMRRCGARRPRSCPAGASTLPLAHHPAEPLARAPA